MFDEPILEPILRKFRINVAKKYITKGSKICDIGCGKKPYFLKAISPIINQGFGFDEEIEDHHIQNLTFKKIRLSNNLPLTDNFCNHITMLAVIEHLENPNAILSEVFRCLKPEGTLIMTFPSKKSEKLLLLFAKLGLVSKKEIFDHKNYFSNSEMMKLLTEIGFEEQIAYTFELGFNNCIVATKPNKSK